MAKDWIIFRYITLALLTGVTGCAFFQDATVAPNETPFFDSISPIAVLPGQPYYTEQDIYLVAQATDPDDDPRIPAEYRRDLVRTLLARALADCVSRCQEGQI